MFDFSSCVDLNSCIKLITDNQYLQLIDLAFGVLGIGIIGVVASVIQYFRQERKILKQQAIVNTSLLCRWFLDCFLRAYLRRIFYQHRIFNIKGLRTRGECSIELDHVFVELRIAPSSQLNQPHRELLTAKELQGNQPIWEFLRFGNKQRDQLLLAIIGAPGCGKTTLLQHVALQFATKAPKGLPKWIPILLFLRQQVKTILAERPALGDLVQHHFSDSKHYPNLQPPAHWFQQQLNAGNCLILLDGLDEVANAEERKQISAWIDEQIVNYPRCPFVVTSRPQGYHAAPLARATIVLEVQAFTTAQVNQFIKSWYLATEITSFGGKDDPGVRLRAEQEAEDLQQRLQARPALQDLTVNPLLLTMIAMVHRYRGQLPGRRVELYAEICDVLLGHWREAKGIQDSLTAAQKRVALQPLAAWMMENSVREVEISKALEVIAEPLNMLGVTDGQAFLKDIQASSGLFSEREMNVWSFAHLTFQEYLAAAHYKDQKIHGNWWHRKVTDSWWQETLLLYAAQADATPIVKSCLNSNNSTALTLAADCLEEALQLDAAVRQQVETRLIANLESDDPELFELATEVKLQRRLRNLQRIDEKREIDVTFISCAEYQLFLYDIQGWDFHLPRHQVESRFPKGSAMKPVLGVRAHDAKAFCLWLSQKTGEKYRLPQPKEVRDSVQNELQLTTWCYEKDSYDLVWSSERYRENAEQALRKVSDLPIFIGDHQKYIDDINLNFSEDLKKTIAFNCAFKWKILEQSERVISNPNIYHMITFGILSAGWGILASLLSGGFAGMLIGTMLAWQFRRMYKHLSSQEISSLNLEVAQNALGFKTNFPTHDDMLNVSRVIKNLAENNKFYANYCMKEAQEQLNTLADNLSAMLEETTDIQLARKEFFKQITGYLYSMYELGNSSVLKKEYLPLGWLREKVEKDEYKRQIILQLHWWFATAIARQKGELPAWEGIRIVRERDV